MLLGAIGAVTVDGIPVGMDVATICAGATAGVGVGVWPAVVAGDAGDDGSFVPLAAVAAGAA